MPYYSRNVQDEWLSGGGKNLVLSVVCPSSGCRRQPDIAISGTQDYINIKVGEVVCGIGSADETSLPKKEATAKNVQAMRKWLRATRCGQIFLITGEIMTNICARPGDSGGPLYSQTNHKAYGILSHGTEMKDLKEPEKCHPEVERNWYEPVAPIINWANQVRDGYGYNIVDRPAGRFP
jgi:hypothetical protein